MELSFRPPQAKDGPTIIALCVDSILHSAKGAYTPQQIQAWADAMRDMEGWRKRLTEQYVLVGVLNNRIVGIISLHEKDGYLDLLYVDKNYQSMGIARRLYEMIMLHAQEKKIPKLTVHASQMAKPFFLKMGWQEGKQDTKAIGGVQFVRQEMTRKVA
jgi:putative acetyltransferase